MTSREAMLEILGKAYQIEVDGYTFYSMTAQRADKPAVRELFEKLAQDEVQHKAFLTTVAEGYKTQGAAAFAVNARMPDARLINQLLFTGRFREQAATTQFELGVLSIGMTLETNAMAYFSRVAAQASEAEVKSFYQFLADWEKQHFDALQGLYNAIRSEVMADSGFSPF
jgi:rubrerythrin